MIGGMGEISLVEALLSDRAMSFFHGSVPRCRPFCGPTVGLSRLVCVFLSLHAGGKSCGCAAQGSVHCVRTSAARPPSPG